ncbi:hypothetical protein GCM10027580_22100 [Corynebacterium faecale]|uniref:hypothetical protein n=1 Tax=Corynebacterium faecale TaxID=1758466 RepID=UPI0025B3BA3F|nr:hypothetical protein [Corynebacterium faecale]
MIDNFIRPPRGFSEIAADLIRMGGLLSFFLALIFFELTQAAVVAFTLPGFVIARFLGVKPLPDAILTSSLIIAAWSNVFELYTSISWWDLIIHFICAGGLAAAAYIFLARVGAVPPPGTHRVAGIFLTTSLGLALGVLWEVVEWVGFTYITSQIYVTYEDTISDLVVGGLGALVCGIAVAYAPLLRDEPVSAPSHPFREQSGNPPRCTDSTHTRR